jgi:hypothetical protein
VALALAANLPRADAATRAMPFVRRTRGKAGVLVTPDPLTRCVRFVRVSTPPILSPFCVCVQGLRLNFFLGGVGLVRRGTLVRPYPGASIGRLQCCWSRAGEQGYRQHPSLPWTFLPGGPVKDIRTRTILEERRQSPRLFTHFTLFVLHRR